MKRVKFYTFGCKVNNYETEIMIANLRSMGLDIIQDSREADIFVVNSCAVTSVSEKKVKQLVRRIRRKNENSIIIVSGCYSQSEPDELLANEVNVTLGTKNRDKLTEVVDNINAGLIDSKTSLNLVVGSETLNFSEKTLENYLSRSRAEIKIQDGCDNFCSYCVIPNLRGAPVSRNIKSIIKEVKSLANSGFVEVVLVGINLAKYQYENCNLIDVIARIEAVEGIQRIRLSSLNMSFFTLENINIISTFKKMCPHFHISLQSGCDSVLNRMGRKYVFQEYFEVITNLRKIIKNVEITTDIIVGFPDETDEEFEISLKNVKKCKFSHIHIFRYSRRKMTWSDILVKHKIWNLVDEKVKRERLEKLTKLSLDSKRSRLSKYVGSNMKVLFEDSKSGFTDNYLKILLREESTNIDDVVGKIKKVEILDLSNDGEVLIGKLIPD